MKNYIEILRNKTIKALGGYVEDDLSFYKEKYSKQNDELVSKTIELLAYYNFFLDAIQGKNRNIRGEFCSRDSLKEYFAWCHTYGVMPHKKLTNAFIRYESAYTKVKSVKRTSEDKNERVNAIGLTIQEWIEYNQQNNRILSEHLNKQLSGEA